MGRGLWPQSTRAVTTDHGGPEACEDLNGRSRFRPDPAPQAGGLGGR